MSHVTNKPPFVFSRRAEHATPKGETWWETLLAFIGFLMCLGGLFSILFIVSAIEAPQHYEEICWKQPNPKGVWVETCRYQRILSK